MYARSEQNNVYQNIVLLPRRTGMQPNGMTQCACVKLWSKWSSTSLMILSLEESFLQPIKSWLNVKDSLKY